MFGNIVELVLLAFTDIRYISSNVRTKLNKLFSVLTITVCSNTLLFIKQNNGDAFLKFDLALGTLNYDETFSGRDKIMLKRGKCH